MILCSGIVTSMATIGLIGAGNIGSQLARLAVAHGYDVVMSNSRGPETLTALVTELGPKRRERQRWSRQRRPVTSSW